ncbi:MAG: hypothetical protein GY749_09000 [Desulfobacteraceae bacterium]|nr:hypothetical protein [Desulfobacteraceae bacterium]
MTGKKKGSQSKRDPGRKSFFFRNSLQASSFTYTLDGSIIPSDKKDVWAEKTIEKLGLNCPRLKDRRMSIIKGLDNSGKGPDPTYLKAVIKENLKEEKTWPFGCLLGGDLRYSNIKRSFSCYKWKKNSFLLKNIS